MHGTSKQAHKQAMVLEDSSIGAGGLHGCKLSTVVPAHVTGNTVVHELAAMDLAMKLHYLRSVYYYRGSESIGGLEVMDLKLPMFPLLDIYYPTAGRIRRLDSGRPFIKCNDSGVRIIQAECDLTVDEWLERKDPAGYKQLVSDRVLGPDLEFSPTVLIQFTRFKGGGLAVGFSWAHILGDPVSATNFINLWGQILSGKMPSKTYCIRDPNSTIKETPEREIPMRDYKPLSVKQVNPVGDHWIAPSDCKMATFSFHITQAKMKHLQSSISSHVHPFEALSAVIWQCLAKIRVGSEPKLVTICRNDVSVERIGILANEQTISTVLAEHSPAKVELSELAMLIEKQTVGDNKVIEELVDRESCNPDLVVYGANLTFVDMEGIDLYGLELRDQKPMQVDCSIDGVGDEGVVLVLPGPEGTEGRGRVVTLILPMGQMQQLREVLQCAWDIA